MARSTGGAALSSLGGHPSSQDAFASRRSLIRSVQGSVSCRLVVQSGLWACESQSGDKKWLAALGGAAFSSLEGHPSSQDVVASRRGRIRAVQGSGITTLIASFG